MTRRHAVVETSLGELLLVADHDGAVADPGLRDALCGIYFPGHWYPPDPDSTGNRVAAGEDRLFLAVGMQLAEYLAGDRRDFDLPVRTSGDAFSEQVWALLREIPYGETTTYGALAVALGNRNLAQRVGQCVGRNPVSIVIPCHRVVGADGSLTGFAGGLERKRKLLELEEPEAVSASRLF
ncbi:methylated-DNA--[protein]-cysteine S-methyltransferase [Leucobacter zeae]|nr:methylated-DNA--[protein]-cysteine S-methyltransferase [Leucobacter zeae]